MKQLLVIISIFLISCSKSGGDPTPQPPSYPYIFWNTNITFRDITPQIQSGVFTMGCTFLHISDVKKWELIGTNNPGVVISTGTPVNGDNWVKDWGRSTLTPKKMYVIRFTRNDNTTFQTGEFEA